MTYGDLKCRKAELRNLIKEGVHDREVYEEYRVVLRRIRWAETWLLWGIACLMMIVSSCQTIKGVTGDSAWMLQKLSDNVVIEK